MEYFSYKDGCGIRERMCIEAFKEELAWAIVKRLRLIINTTFFNAVISLRI